MLSRQVKSRIKANQKKRLLHLWVSQDKRGIPLSDQKQLAVLVHWTTRRCANQAVDYLLGYDPGHPDGDKSSLGCFVSDALKTDPEDQYVPGITRFLAMGQFAHKPAVWSGRAVAQDALDHWKENIHGADWEVDGGR